MRIIPALVYLQKFIIKRYRALLYEHNFHIRENISVMEVSK